MSAVDQVVVVLHDVNNDEVELGPFSQVCFELELVGQSMMAVCKDVVTREPIVYSAGGWWFHDGRPFKQAHVRSMSLTE